MRGKQVVKLVKVAPRLPFISTQLNGSLVAMVVHRCEYAKLADRWPAAVGGHDRVSSYSTFMRD
jgi:hypothetical protein